MRTLLVVPISLALLVGFAAPASAAPSGTFSATITGTAPPLNGKWQIKFVSGNKADIFRNGKRVGVTGVSFSDNKMKLTDRSTDPSDRYRCDGSQKIGTYKYRLSGKKLTFTAVSDRCAGRKAALTMKPFIKS